MATSALLSTAGRQLCTSTASRIVPREVTASHKLTVDGYASSKLIADEKHWVSPTFEAAGSSWRIRYGPYWPYCYEYEEFTYKDQCISLELELLPNPNVDPDNEQMAKFKFSLLDPASGNPVPKFTRDTTEFRWFDGNGSSQGFGDFITCKDLEVSGYLKDDCFAVRCDITVLSNLKKMDDDEGAPGDGVTGVMPVRPSDLRQQLRHILWNKRGTDIAIDVNGEETVEAHGWLLAARSPVFEAELLALAAKEDDSSSLTRRIEVQGVEPKVFKSMLHYMYTDTLPPPETEQEDVVAMAQGLLATAHRFKLEGLKVMCEETLCKHVTLTLDTVVGALAAAEKHDCRALKAACVEFITRPGNLKALVKTEGFLEKMRVDCPAVMWEILLKKVA